MDQPPNSARKPRHTDHGSAPATPAGLCNDLNSIIERLATKYHLPLHARTGETSPNTEPRTNATLCVNLINFLYYQDRTALQQTLTSVDEFDQSEKPERVLDYLVKTLQDRSRLTQEQRLSFGTRTPSTSEPGVPQRRRPLLDGGRILFTTGGGSAADEILSLPLTENDKPPLQPRYQSLSSRDVPGHVDPARRPEDFARLRIRDGGRRIFDGGPLSTTGHSLSGSATVPTVPSEDIRPSTPTEDVMDVTPPDSPTPSGATGDRRRTSKKQISTDGVLPDRHVESIKFARPEKPTTTKRVMHESGENRRPPKRVQASEASSAVRLTDSSLFNRIMPLNQSFPSANISFTSAGSASIFESRNGGVTANTSFTSVATEPHEVDDNGDMDAYGSTPSFPEDVEMAMDTKHFDEALDLNVSRVAAAKLAMTASDGKAEGSVSRMNSPEKQLAADLAHAARQDNIHQGLAAMHFQVRNFPCQGLVERGNDDVLPEASMRVRYEVLRLSLRLRCHLHDVFNGDVTDLEDYSTLWACFKSYADRSQQQLPRPTPLRVWTAAGAEFKNVSLKATMVINPSTTGPLLVLKPEPLTKELSCRFQRKFGSERFLYLNMPAFMSSNLPNHLKDELSNIRDRYLGWLISDKYLFGRCWRVVLLENKRKGRKGTRWRRSEQPSGQQLVLFATSGHGLQQRIAPLVTPREDLRSAAISVEELLQWFMPLKKNAKQPYCKAYARLELGFSKTIPTLIFQPHQVRRVPDISADGCAECMDFDDGRLPWDDLHNLQHRPVMNDGCSRMSVGAARSVWAMLKKRGPIPSAFQGRIGGWKGMWMVSGPTDTRNSQDNGIWIEVTTSQRKFEPHDEDRTDACDPDRLTFEVLTYPITPPHMSTFHAAFLPILEDRGVSRKTLCDIITGRLNMERSLIETAVQDPLRLRHWIHGKYSLLEEAYRDENAQWQAGLPRNLREKAILLLESSFEPSACEYLQEVVDRLVFRYLSRLKQTITFPISRSTYVFALADPLKILRPGEVHLAFSTNFQDDDTEDSYFHLDGLNVLVARHPALRPSDMQKVHAVYKPELSHLRDVIVCPTVGTLPLAGKLQGGDYDGDTFWVCWEPPLVDSFKNAPQPLHLPMPQDLGIEVDQTTLGDLLSKPEGAEEVIRRSLEFRTRPEFLGICTNFHGDLAYAENSIRTPATAKVADLHHYLIDCPKSGFTYTPEAWTIFKKGLGVNQKKVREPAYRSAMKSSMEDKTRSPRKTRSYTTSAVLDTSPLVLRPIKPKYKPEHITDYLVFEVIEPHNAETLRRLDSLLNTNCDSDSDLESIYLRELQNPENKVDNAVPAVLKELTDSLHEVRDLWSKNIAPKPDFDADIYNRILEQCFDMYTAILPSSTHLSHPHVRSWVHDTVGHAPSYWALLKASALYVKFSARWTFTFALAGKELAYIKAWSQDDARVMAHGFWAAMKPRRLRRGDEWVEGDGRAGVGGDGGGEGEGEGEDEFADDVLDGLGDGGFLEL